MLKKIIKLFEWWHYVLLVLFGLTPVLWFINRSDVLINGLDTNFPLDPVVWLNRRFYVWNGIINAGSDFSSSTSGLFFHMLQVLPFIVGVNLQLTQIITLLFWFFAVVFSAYYLAKSITPESKIAQLIFVVIYSFNPYLFNTWENIKVSNLSLMVALPLLLGLVYRYRISLISKKNLFIYSVGSAIVISGSGINPAYLVTIILGITLYGITVLLINKNVGDVKRLWGGVLMIVLVLILVNSFWILPLVDFLFIAKKATSISDLGFTNWLDSLSQNTSLLNVIRLQGAWDWYATNPDGTPLYIPYSVNYLRKPLFIIFSFIVPIMSVVSLIYDNRKKAEIRIYFAILMILGIFLGSGSHEPTGYLYKILSDKISLFSFFRSPWYIFTPLLLLSFAGLASLLYCSLCSAGVKKYILRLGATIFILCYLVYNYPLVTGRIFRPNNDGFFVKFPTYVFETMNWLKNTPPSFRIITYPDDQLENFIWGYKGTESILGLFSSAEFITPSFNSNSKIFQALLDKFYLHIKKNEYPSAISMLPVFGADTIFNKNDIKFSLSRKINESDQYLNSHTTLKKIGPWSFFQLKDSTTNRKIFIPSSIYLNLSDQGVYPEITTALPRQTLVFNDLSDKSVDVLKIDARANLITRVVNTTLGKNPTGNEHTFAVSLPKFGHYFLTIDRNGINSSSQLKIFLDGQILDKVPTQETDSLFIFGPVALPSGDYNIKVIFPIDSDPVKYSDVSSYSNYNLLRNEELPIDTKKTLLLFNADNYERRVVLPVYNFNPFLKYSLAFDYKYFYGSVPIVSLIQSAAMAPVKSYSEIIGSSFDWEHKNILVENIPTDSKLEIVFSLPGNKIGNRSKSFIENISLSRVYDNNIYLIQSQEDNRYNTKTQVNYTRISPVEYRVRANEGQEGFFLVFLENYSPRWVLDIEGENKKPVHFAANGYANGWYIPPGINERNIRIYYLPQYLYILGVGISGFIIVITAVLLALIYIRRAMRS